MTEESTILLASAGRRPYLVRWFKEALELNGLSGRVVLADTDQFAPARAVADDFVHAPLARDPEYVPWLAKTIADNAVDVAVSVNDFEISTWSRLHSEPAFSALVRTTADIQESVEDKVAMSAALLEQGISVPSLEKPSHALAMTGRGDEAERIVIKGRFGSASRGLRVIQRREVAAVMASAHAEVTERDGRATSADDDPDATLVVQSFIEGEEFGLDVVCDFTGEYATVLVRKKLAMRNGETDRAVSVDAARFELLARKLSAALPHKGVFDVDIIVDSAGDPWVIDVNPRFGGGYPFSHTAGAHIPAAYVAWANDLPVAPEWLASEGGVLSGKSVEVVRIR